MSDTLLLDTTTWDLVVDSQGNIAVASRPYALAQDVACAIRLFLGELWYDTSKGIPYFQRVLGKPPPLSLFQQYAVDAALAVPGVVSAVCVIQAFSNRVVTGQVQFIDDQGTSHTVGF